MNNMEKTHHDLQRGLLPRHVQFIALAGMIGTGIFKGSSDTLNMAGPSVVIAYLIGGLLLFIVMAALGEMATVFPNLNVQHLINKAFGFQLSFIVGWLYWFNWIIVIIVEIVADRKLFTILVSFCTIMATKYTMCVSSNRNKFVSSKILWRTRVLVCRY